MLPSDFSPEKQARQRFLQREADMRLHSLKEAKRVPLIRAVRDVLSDLGLFRSGVGLAKTQIPKPGLDRRITALKTGIVRGKPFLLAAAKDVVDDLERFVRFQGAGPDVRLANLKAAITRSILGEDRLHEVTFPTSKDPGITEIRNSVKFLGKGRQFLKDRPEPVWEFEIKSLKPSELPSRYFQNFVKNLSELEWEVIRGFKKLTIKVLAKSQAAAQKELINQINRA